MDKMEVDYKRKRINFYKRIIITTILASILIPIALCVILLLKVHTLEKKLDGLEQMVLEYNLEMEKQVEALSERMTEQTAEAMVVPETVKTELPTTTAEPEKADIEEKKKVYLTFDDGPSANTDEILDILRQYDVKATFFVVGKTDEASKEAYRRIVEEGHTLGMHSYSHVYDLVYSSREEFESDMLKLQSYL